MRRREFLTFFGGVLIAKPLSAHAQGERMRRIGVLLPSGADDTEYEARMKAFTERLVQLGWIEGQNIQIERRWGKGNAEQTRKLAAELVALAPDVILAPGSSATGPLLQATSTIPIVFATIPDPVAAGYVESLSRPGGNATGFASFEYSIGGKWLELLKEIAPSVTRVAVIRDNMTLAGVGQVSAIQSVASSLRVELVPINFRSPAELEKRSCSLREPLERLARRARGRSGCPPQADCHSCGQTSVARRLCGPCLCGAWRSDVLWNGSRRSVSASSRIR